MRRVLSGVYATVAFAASGTGTFALLNWLDDKHRPLWTGAVFALVFCLAGPLVMRYCEERGWITGFVARSKELEKRKEELAAERERIIAQTRARHA